MGMFLEVFTKMSGSISLFFKLTFGHKFILIDWTFIILSLVYINYLTVNINCNTNY